MSESNSGSPAAAVRRVVRCAGADVVGPLAGGLVGCVPPVHVVTFTA